MAIDFDKLKDDLFSVGKEVGDRVSDVSNIAKLKLDVRSKEDFLERQFAQLGRMYYAAHKNDVEAVAEQDTFVAIAETEAQIEGIKQTILDLQGAVCCPNCGEKYQKGFKFCPSCGAELKKEAAPEDDMFVDEEAEAVEAEVVDDDGAEEVQMDEEGDDAEIAEDAATEEVEFADDTAAEETDLDALDGTVVKEVVGADCNSEEVKPAIEEAIEKEIQSKEAAEHMQAE